MPTATSQQARKPNHQHRHARRLRYGRENPSSIGRDPRGTQNVAVARLNHTILRRFWVGEKRVDTGNKPVAADLDENGTTAIAGCTHSF